ncbi:hypothetical protein Tco_0179623 [Tanacetum coccineum]
MVKTQLTTALGCIQTLEAKDLEPQDEPAEAGSSSIIIWHAKNAPKENTTQNILPPTTPMTDAQIKALIDQGVADADG